MRAAAEADEVVVVDASVIVALVAASAASTGAIARRLDRAILHAPALLPIEVDSALRGLERGGRLAGPQASSARPLAAGIPIDLWPWQLLAERAWQLRGNLTTYDAGYVALAERLDAPLLTADARLARASGARCTIEVLELSAPGTRT